MTRFQLFKILFEIRFKISIIFLKKENSFDKIQLFSKISLFNYLLQINYQTFDIKKLNYKTKKILIKQH